MGSPSADFSIVLPAHNEAANIAPMVVALKAVLTPFGQVEIIFVDDGSNDGTLAALRTAAAAHPEVRYLSFTRNFGHEAALRAGLRTSRGAAVIVIDADLEQPPGLIPDLVGQWRAGFKIVTARRIGYESTVPWFKRVTSRLYYQVLDALGDVHIEPGSANYMLMDRVVVDAVNRFEDQDLFLRGVVRWLGYPLTSVPFQQSRRTQGDSKYTLRRMVDLAVTGIAVHSVRPLRFAIWLALGFAALGGLLVIYSVVSFLFVQHTVAGWTSIMAAIAILGAAQLLVLGIVGEYVGRILRETRKRPSYIVAETEADQRTDSAGTGRLARPPE
ncbi:MAG: polyisoprenyl-phosphate glycosyltransferase [Alphaproteobacteria bacterium]|nr:polyisoprenyl-phosphate glycosyltransferase [Alphaproteobacteria bacterium]